MSRVAYITQSALSKAYATNDLRWMIHHWREKGIDGCYPTLELYDFAVNQVFIAHDAVNNSIGEHELTRALQLHRNWKNIAKFIDTVITHRDYRTHNPITIVVGGRNLKTNDIYHQLTEVA